MAVVEILQWSLELMTYLSDRVARPASFAELKARYPQLSRNTLKNRLDTLVEARWLLETNGCYAPHPEMARLYARINKSFETVSRNALETMKIYESH